MEENKKEPDIFDTVKGVVSIIATIGILAIVFQLIGGLLT
jgi:FlaG/FlaF family flagellin (archaellin)